jgi:hypothetical protein
MRYVCGCREARNSKFLVTVKVTSQNSDEDFSRKTKVLEDIQMMLKIQ